MKPEILKSLRLSAHRTEAQFSIRAIWDGDRETHYTVQGPCTAPDPCGLEC